MQRDFDTVFAELNKALDDLAGKLRDLDRGIDGLGSSVDKMASNTLIFGVVTGAAFLAILMIALAVNTP